jgi:Domain of unknown function DUF29
MNPSTPKSRSSSRQMTALYDRDFYRWTLETAAALRSGRLAEVDLEHAAEEIEDMGKRDMRAVVSRLQRILEHKLKLELTEGQIFEFNERKWRHSIAQQQIHLARILKDSPSLKSRLPDLISDAYQAAARTLENGYDIPAPAKCPWTIEQILG